MQYLLDLWRNPARRRLALTILSGALILISLVAEYSFGLAATAYPLMVAAALIAGSDIALRAWSSLRSRYISIESLVTIAAAGALVIGEAWEAAAVTFLFLLGATLEARTMERTRRTLQGLLELAPMSAIVLRDGRQVKVSPREVARGETVIVKPGATIPVDGEVIDGRAAVDEHAVTGESLAVEKEAEAPVYAGTIAQNGLLRVRAEGVGADTTLARIIQRVEEAQEARVPVQRFIDRFARWYTPAVIGLSVAVGLFFGDARLALTLLVIGCPGALVIAAPVAVVAGIGRAAQHGILIKGGAYLERAGKISALTLDKTGTLTEGRPRLTDVVTLAPVPTVAGKAPALESEGAEWSMAQRDVLRWAAIAESGSEHPLARPIVAAAETLEVVPQAESVAFSTGRGITATYDGHVIGVGSSGLMDELGIEVAPEARSALERLRHTGRTAVLVVLDGLVLGVLGIADTLRPGAREAVEQLRRAGARRIEMLTGDNARTARAIAEAVGVDAVQAELLPDQKLEHIRELQRQGHVVAMVGDGINDAPALATADVGIAMGAAGSDVAIETAPVALMSDDLDLLPQAVRLSRMTLRIIRQNLALALLTVGTLLLGVLFGYVDMAGGMLIHQLSVLLVVINGLRLMRA